MEKNDPEYVNAFTDVHKKIKAAKDRLRETYNSDAELRESRSMQEAKKILEDEPK